MLLVWGNNVIFFSTELIYVSFVYAVKFKLIGLRKIAKLALRIFSKTFLTKEDI